MFNNMTIKSRLIFVIGMLSLLLVGVGSLGLFGINQSNAGLKSVYEDRTVPAVMLVATRTIFSSYPDILMDVTQCFTSSQP